MKISKFFFPAVGLCAVVYALVHARADELAKRKQAAEQPASGGTLTLGGEQGGTAGPPQAAPDALPRQVNLAHVEFFGFDTDIVALGPVSGSEKRWLESLGSCVGKRDHQLTLAEEYGGFVKAVYSADKPRPPDECPDGTVVSVKRARYVEYEREYLERRADDEARLRILEHFRGTQH